MQRSEFQAGATQAFVVYSPDDTGSEIDPVEVYGEVAADAAEWAAKGWHVVSTTAVPTRHAQAFLGREGSGYDTKMSVIVVYANP